MVTSIMQEVKVGRYAWAVSLCDMSSPEKQSITRWLFRDRGEAQKFFDREFVALSVGDARFYRPGDSFKLDFSCGELTDDGNWIQREPTIAAITKRF